MGQPYIGEIRLWAGNFQIAGWVFCDGRLLSIADNSALFNLIGTTYGGDGQTTFAVPDLRSRLPVHQGSGPGLTPRPISAQGGAEGVTLTSAQIPAHNHPLPCQSTGGTQTGPGNAGWANSSANPYQTGTANVAMNAGNIGLNNNGQAAQPHANLMPYLTLNFIISLFGIYPSPT